MSNINGQTLNVEKTSTTSKNEVMEIKLKNSFITPSRSTSARPARSLFSRKSLMKPIIVGNKIIKNKVIE